MTPPTLTACRRRLDITRIPGSPIIRVSKRSSKHLCLTCHKRCDCPNPNACTICSHCHQKETSK